MKQSNLMLNGEGDAWLKRNRQRLGKHDPVSDLMAEMKIAPAALLEIGCANGWRLDKLRRKHHCLVCGVEPSIDGVKEAAALGIAVTHGTARNLPFMPRSFDTIVFGFSLYLSDPEDWLYIAAEADRVLEDDGLIIIHDFYANDFGGVVYEHDPRITSWHYDFSKLWLSHPLYYVLHRKVMEDEAVTVLRKKPVPRRA